MTYAAAVLFAFLPSSPDLAALENAGRYFELRDAVAKRKDEEPDTLFYRGLTRSRFGDAAGAEADLQAFVKRNPKDKTRAAAALLALAQIEGRAGKYREAVQHLDEAFGPFLDGMDAPTRAATETYRSVWKAVVEVPPQTVTAAKASSVPVKRGLGLRIPVTFGDQSAEFLFDTGANFSCLSTSMAECLGAKLQTGTVQVQSLTGANVPARMAEIPEFRIGNATVQHAIALVFADKDLAVPNSDVRFDAILGFPVIAGLRQISLTRNDKLEIPAKPGPKRGADLCLDGLTPLVQATAFEKKGTYIVDTGAHQTDLYPPFFRDHESEIRTQGYQVDVEVTGVGQNRKIGAWRSPSFTLTLAGKKLRLESPYVLTEPTTARSAYVHGYLGQDLLRQFEKITFNFDQMSLALE